MGDAFKYVIRNGGLATESAYAYKESDGVCKSAKPVATISGYTMVPSKSESSLQKAVSKQPVSVGIDGNGYDFQFYSGSGVFTGSCGTNIHHAVTIVGYGAESDGTKYWLIKNSWGKSWGDNGYGKIERGIGAPEGRCGIAIYATYPVA